MRGLWLMCLVLGSVFQAKSQEINWLSWEEVAEKMHEEPRKIFVDVYTMNCGWCKKMDATTFKNEELVEYINEHYYAIKFDAEYTEPILLHGEEYGFIKTGRKGYHELAYKILRGRLSFPSLVFMDSNMKVIQPLPGYRDAKTLEMILSYYDEDHHKSMPWKTYTKVYQQENTTDTPRKNIGVHTVGTGKGN